MSTRRQFIGTGVGTFVGASLAACGLGEHEPREVPWRDQYRVAKAMLRIANDMTGIAVQAGPDRYSVITAYSGNRPEFNLTNPEGQTRLVTVQGVLDGAVARLEDPEEESLEEFLKSYVEPLPLGSTRAQAIGDAIVILSFPEAPGAGVRNYDAVVTGSEGRQVLASGRGLPGSKSHRDMRSIQPGAVALDRFGTVVGTVTSRQAADVFKMEITPVAAGDCFQMSPQTAERYAQGAHNGE